MAARQGGKRDLVRTPRAAFYAERTSKGRLKPGYGNRGDQKR